MAIGRVGTFFSAVRGREGKTIPVREDDKFGGEQINETPP